MHKQMYEVSHHHKEKFSWLLPIRTILASCFSIFAYYHCCIQPTNVWLTTTVYITMCVARCIREDLGFQSLKVILNQTPGLHYPHVEGEYVVKTFLSNFTVLAAACQISTDLRWHLWAVCYCLVVCCISVYLLHEVFSAGPGRIKSDSEPYLSLSELLFFLIC